MNGQNITFSDMLLPALIGGGIAGVLSGMPYVSCLCCLWLLAGGLVAVYMLRGRGLSSMQLLSLGIFVGFFAAVAGSIIDVVTSLVSGADYATAMRQVMEAMRQSGAPPETMAQMEQIARLMSGVSGAFIMVCGFFLKFVIYSMFACVGTFLGKTLVK